MIDKSQKMESRWFLFAGQTLENSRIEDRGHALHAGKSAWNRIMGHLDRSRLKQEAIEADRERWRKIQEGSYNMTKDWENSVEQISLRKEEERKRKADAKEHDKIERYHVVMAEVTKMKEDYVNAKRRTMLVTRGPSKELNSALLIAEVAKVRDKQLELQHLIKQNEQKNEEREGARIRQAAVNEKIENEEKYKKWREKNQKLAEDLRQERLERENDLMRQRKLQIDEEQDEINKGLIEIEAIRKQKRDEKAKWSKEAKDIRDKERRDLKNKKDEENKWSSEMDQVGKAIQESRYRICDKKKQMARAEIERRQAKTAAIGANMLDLKAAKQAEYDRVVNKAIKEKNEENEELFQAKQMYLAKLKKERIDAYVKYLEHEEDKKQDEKELRKWDLANSFKHWEVMEEHEKNRIAKQRQKEREYRKELWQQALDKKAEIKNDQQDERNYIKSLNALPKDQDEEFLGYAQEVYEEAKSKGYTTYPIEKCIMDYKKKTGILLRKDWPVYCEKMEASQYEKKRNPKYQASHKRFYPTYYPDMEVCTPTKVEENKEPICDPIERKLGHLTTTAPHLQEGHRRYYKAA